MKTLSLSEAKMKLSALVEALRVTGEEVLITKNGAPAAVLVSPDEFEGWKETQAVRGDADLLAEIKNGLAAFKKTRSRSIPSKISLTRPWHATWSHGMQSAYRMIWSRLSAVSIRS